MSLRPAGLTRGEAISTTRLPRRLLRLAMTMWRERRMLRKPLEQLPQLDRVDPAIPIFDDRGGIQRYPFEHCPLVIRQQMPGADMQARASADDGLVRYLHLVAMGDVDLDPNIVTG